ncbi:MAG: hypothetical protein CR986_03855 [Ignavibacteriae bacterium]|nr:MAG: hypothetical protein CR986_03855 [Ignavibacteriota bacterium]
MKNFIKIIILLFFALFISSNAQSTRGLVNDGVDDYEAKKFPEAEAQFKKGVDSDIENFVPRFNLGDAIFKQGRFEEALKEFKKSLTLAETEETQAGVYHNIGNTFIKSQKLKESIAAYKEALKRNPNDMETKYNLSYALKQMQNQQNNQQQQKQDQNKDNKDNKDQNNQDQDQNQNKDNKDKDKEQDKKQDQNKNQQKQQPQQKEDISKDEAQRILDALKNNEAELQKKMRQKKSKKSNVEKDW